MRLLTLKTVLVATDLDDQSGAVLRTAAKLAELSGAQLHLLHATSVPTPEHDAQLERLYAAFVPEGPAPTSIMVLHGSPQSLIVQQAAALEADAIVLGPHRRGVADIGEMGSTAAAVVRTAPCPCLVVPTELRLPLERLLVPIALRDRLSDALAIAITWGSALRPRENVARLIVLHVSPSGGSSRADDDLAAAVRSAREYAGPEARVDIDEGTQVGDDPAAIILERAQAEAPDLLVIGSRLHADGEPELGNVTRVVARSTPCPLLLVPPGIVGAG